MFLKYALYFLYWYIYSPTCQTVVSDLLFWYSGPDLIVFEDEPEEAAGEPQRLVEWQADSVIKTLGRALRCIHFGSLRLTYFREYSFGCTDLCWSLLFWGCLMNLHFV